MQISARIKDVIRSILPEGLIQTLVRHFFGRVDEIYWIHKMFSNSKGLMIDVGAHYGTSMRLFLKANWEIHAFEPSNKNRKILLEKYKDRQNLFIYNYGLSDKAVKGIDFFESEVSSGISSISKFHKSHEVSQKIDLNTLSNFLKSKNINGINFLKIDTEGHDLFVLKGMPWDSTRPQVILCEYEDRKTLPLGHSTNDIVDYLLNLRYIVYVSEWKPIQEYGKSHKWHRVFKYRGQKIDSKSWGNLIAIRDDLDSRFSSKIK